MDRVQHVPTAIILQFVSTFGVWILAEQIGLSGVLTMVSSYCAPRWMSCCVSVRLNMRASGS